MLGYVVPLLLGYDTTYTPGGEEANQPQFYATSDSQEKGPAFLGLGFERSNIQVWLRPYTLLGSWEMCLVH